MQALIRMVQSSIFRNGVRHASMSIGGGSVSQPPTPPVPAPSPQWGMVVGTLAAVMSVTGLFAKMLNDNGIATNHRIDAINARIDATNKRIDDVRKELKEDNQKLREELRKEIHDGFGQINRELGKINAKLSSRWW